MSAGSLKKMVVVVLGMLVVGVLGLSYGCGGSGGDEGCDPDRVIEDVERLMMPPGVPGSLDIRLGELPEGFPAEVPLPDDAELVGSVVYPTGGEYTYIMLLLESDLGPEELMDRYQDELSRSGWTKSEDDISQEGFVGDGMGRTANFCSEDPYYSLGIIAAREAGEQVSLIELMVSNEPDFGVCGDEDVPFSSGEGFVLPELTPPEGAAVSMGESAGSSKRRYSAARIDTGEGIESLHAHYRAQLEEAGWTLVEEEMGHRLAWSDWSFTDEYDSEWSGFLVIRELGDDTKGLLVQADLIRPGEGAPQFGGSWMTTEAVTAPAKPGSPGMPVP